MPTCEQLAAKAYAALAPGGRAFTLDFIPEPDRVTPPSTANFALVMLATTAHGDAYTFAEYHDIFRPGRFPAQRIPRPSADDATGGGVVQGLSGLSDLT